MEEEDVDELVGAYYRLGPRDLSNSQDEKLRALAEMARYVQEPGPDPEDLRAAAQLGPDQCHAQATEEVKAAFDARRKAEDQARRRVPRAAFLMPFRVALADETVPSPDQNPST